MLQRLTLTATGGPQMALCSSLHVFLSVTRSKTMLHHGSVLQYCMSWVWLRCFNAYFHFKLI
jgi:hypothetical protein